ncbi:sugar ABC transporter permease [Mediterraneibacter sp. NSJ-55]|uniref:Sugar ABC transporter permease n=1 Tax=Mediterraneibacter hominis TaxID=2763054 RepID=A0A923RQ06_9FIRM|nr:sugar ABC transporter permease [Mediterraneibacter hominis]MBC5689069.1 sugar ABC transporter permease [Mediterraneibacter hominis]
MNQKRRAIIEYICFLAPMCVIFTVISLVPFFEGIRLSFRDWNGVSATSNFVGLENYINIFQDEGFRNACLFSLKFVICSVILVNVIGLALALAVNSKLKTKNILRTAFFLPQLIGGLVVGYIWNFIFSNVFPKLAEKLQWSFLDVGWFTSPTYAFLTILIVFVWQYSGYLMIIYVAALQNVPSELIESAKIDGAGNFQRLRLVILPLIRSSITICIFLAISTAFKMYDLNVSLTGGSPFNSTVSATLYIYREAFKSNRFSYAAAEGVLFALALGIVTLIQMAATRKKEE